MAENIGRLMDFANRHFWVLTALVLGVLIGAAVVMAVYGEPSPFAEVCQNQLGSEWAVRSYADIPNTDHYHVKCTRDAGWFQTERRWIEVSKDRVVA